MKSVGTIKQIICSQAVILLCSCSNPVQFDEKAQELTDLANMMVPLSITLGEMYQRTALSLNIYPLVVVLPMTT